MLANLECGIILLSMCHWVLLFPPLPPPGVSLPLVEVGGVAVRCGTVVWGPGAHRLHQVPGP